MEDETVKRGHIRKSTREAVFVHAEGRSALTGVPLGSDWQVDHIAPVSKGGSDDVSNLQALTRQENAFKSNAVPPALRDWQRECVLAWDRSQLDNFLLVALPGAGKTIAALTIVLNWLRENPERRRVLVVVPTDNLRTQWQAEAAQVFGLQFQTKEFTAWKHHMVGAVVTYQSLASKSELWKLRCRDHEVLVVCDEIHHAGENEWGAALKEAVGMARVRLLMSGTPFRGDSTRIPFVTYDGSGMCVASVPHGFTYDYPRAIREGVIRVVRFQHDKGIVRRLTAIGEVEDELSSDVVDEDEANRILRDLLQVGEYTLTLLKQAHARLIEVRRRKPEAGGLVLCIDQSHAERVAKQLTHIVGSAPDLIVSDDERTTSTVDDFRRSTRPWVVAVRQISEGVDIKRLMVLAYLTTTKSELFFRQAVGRIVRNQGTEEDTEAYCFIPSHHVLVRHAQNITNAQAQAIADESDHEFTDRIERLIMQPGLFSDVVLGTEHSGTAGTIIDGVTLDAGRSTQVYDLALELGCSERVALRVMQKFELPSIPSTEAAHGQNVTRPLEKQIDTTRKALDTTVKRAAFKLFRDDDYRFQKVNDLVKGHIGKRREMLTLEDCQSSIRFLMGLMEKRSDA